MGRANRVDVAGGVYHLLNRANRRETMFHKSEDFEAFERILEEAIDRSDLLLYSYSVMSNHWHMVVSPQVDGEMGRFGQWLTLTHTQRYHAHYGTAGEGHLYQGRYKSFPVQDDDHFLIVCRYVERNPYTAELCEAPDQWRYNSLWRWRHGTAKQKSLLSPWPIPRKSGWLNWVMTPLTEKEEQQLTRSIQRGCPFGDEAWAKKTARQLGFESTLRPRGRPKKLPK